MFSDAIVEEMKIEAREAQRLVPFDTGALHDSIHVEPTSVRGGVISASIIAGGPEAPYAVIVHEDMEAHHPRGQAKFIEQPLRESAGHMAERIKRRIRLDQMG